MTNSAGQLKSAEEPPAASATPIVAARSGARPVYLTTACSRTRFMPNWTAVIGSIAPTLTPIPR